MATSNSANARVEPDPLLDRRLRVVGGDDHGVLVEERVRAAGRVHEALELPVGRRDRGHLGVRPVLVRPGVVVGKREQHEVEQVVLDQVGADAAGVLVADPGHPELAAASRLAARVQVGVEQLARSEDRSPEQRRGDDPGQRGLVGDLVLVAAPVDQIRRAGRPDVGVVERLVHGLDLG